MSEVCGKFGSKIVSHHSKVLWAAGAGPNRNIVETPRKRKRVEISSDNIEVLAAQVKLASQELARAQKECVTCETLCCLLVITL